MKHTKTPLESALFALANSTDSGIYPRPDGELYSPIGEFALVSIEAGMVDEWVEKLRFLNTFPTRLFVAVVLAGPSALVGHWVLRDYNENDYEVSRYESREEALLHYIQLQDQYRRQVEPKE